MIEIGNILSRTYGRVRFTRRKKKDVSVSSIGYQKPARQIGLDKAIKQNQNRIAKEKKYKKARRQKQIKSLRKSFGI